MKFKHLIIFLVFITFISVILIIGRNAVIKGDALYKDYNEICKLEREINNSDNITIDKVCLKNMIKDYNWKIKNTPWHVSFFTFLARSWRKFPSGPFKKFPTKEFKLSVASLDNLPGNRRN